MDDASRIRTSYAVENANIIRKITMNLVRKNASMQRSIPKK